MKKTDNHDVIRSFHRLTDAAETYVNRSPRVKRIQEQRSALVDAIADAQLILSVHQLPKESPTERPSEHKRTPMLEREVKRMRNAIKELNKDLRPISDELEAVQQRARKARTLLDSALAKHRGEEHDS